MARDDRTQREVATKDTERTQGHLDQSRRAKPMTGLSAVTNEPNDTSINRAEQSQRPQCQSRRAKPTRSGVPSEANSNIDDRAKRTRFGLVMSSETKRIFLIQRLRRTKPLELNLFAYNDLGRTAAG